MSTISTPGSLDLDKSEIWLLPSEEAGGGKPIDILKTGFVGDLTIRENLENNFIGVDMSVGDARNVIGNMPIIGGEVITIKLVSTHLDENNPKHVIEQSFRIDEIINRNYIDDREQTYIIRAVSPEAYKNNTQIISERFTGKPQEIFEDIYDRFIKEPKVISDGKNKKDGFPLEFCDISGGQVFKRENFTFVANYWTPYQCMNFLASKVAPADAGGKELMPNVKYFQTTKAHYVASLSRLQAFYKEQNSIYDEFWYVPTGSDPFMLDEKRKTRGGYGFISPFVSNQYSTMSGLSIPLMTQDLGDQISGYQGNATIGFDMTTRLPYHMEFDYSPLQPIRISDNKRVIPSQFKDFYHLADQTPMRQLPNVNPKSSLNVRIGSSQIWTDQKFGYDWRFLLDTAYRDTATEELKRLRVKFDVPGRTDIDLGMLVYLNFPNTDEKGDGASEEELFDARMSGIYSVIGIKHMFSIAKQHHTMTIDVVRDSMGDF